ncbi:hypothetical protein ACHAPQ_011159 [Fusarium lateritium]
MVHRAISRDEPRGRGLLSLPTELLNAIVSEIIGDETPGTISYRFTYFELKDLRLTHERFSNLDYINTILFSHIKLEATGKGLTNYQGADLSRVAQFVQVVTFVGPPTWMLLRETFDRAANSWSLPEYLAPTEAKLESSYIDNMEDAREARELLEESEKLQDVWTQVL